MRPWLLDHSKPVCVHSRKALYVANDKALHSLITSYNNLADGAATSSVILRHLFAVQFRFGERGFYDDTEDETCYAYPIEDFQEDNNN